MLGDAESACLPFGALILPYAYKKKVAESIAAARCLRGWEGEEALSLSLAGVPLELEAMKEDAKMTCLGELGAGLIEAVRGLGKNPLGIHKNRVEGWRIPVLPAMDQSALLREKVSRVACALHPPRAHVLILIKFRSFSSLRLLEVDDYSPAPSQQCKF